METQPLPENPKETPTSAKKPKPAQPATLIEFVSMSGPDTARPFLKRISKGVVSIPEAEEIRAIVKTLIERPESVDRLGFLLKASDGAAPSIRNAIWTAGTAYLRETNILPSSFDGDDSPAYRLAIETQLQKKPAKGEKDPDILGVLLLLGLHQGFLTETEIDSALKRHFSIKSDAQRKGQCESPTAVLLGLPFKRKTMMPAMALHGAWQQQAESLEKSNGDLRAEVTSLGAEKVSLLQQISEGEAKRTALVEENSRLAEAVRDAQQAIADAKNSDRHRYDALRSRVRGFMEGELSRWLQTAFEASSIEPPRIHVIQERLESAVSGIKRESTWLQSLG